MNCFLIIQSFSPNLDEHNSFCSHVTNFPQVKVALILPYVFFIFLIYHLNLKWCGVDSSLFVGYIQKDLVRFILTLQSMWYMYLRLMLAIALY